MRVYLICWLIVPKKTMTSLHRKLQSFNHKVNGMNKLFNSFNRKLRTWEVNIKIKYKQTSKSIRRFKMCQLKCLHWQLSKDMKKNIKLWISMPLRVLWIHWLLIPLRENLDNKRSPKKMAKISKMAKIAKGKFLVTDLISSFEFQNESLLHSSLHFNFYEKLYSLLCLHFSLHNSFKSTCSSSN